MKKENSETNPVSPGHPVLRSMTLLALFLTGCRQQMAEQPSYRPLQPSSFFADGRSARSLPVGVVARGSQSASGKREADNGDWTRIASLFSEMASPTWGSAAPVADWSLYVEDFPAPVTLKTMERGKERFEIYCAVCHDRVGTGHGMIVQRGYVQPPSFHTDLSRGFKIRGVDLPLAEAPVGYYFDVITQGFGAMPSYKAQVPPADRWAIIAYIRALQFSQKAGLDDIGEANERQRLLDSRESQP